MKRWRPGLLALTLLLASGSEVALVLEAQASLQAEGLAARVVSAPSLELFAAQPQEYRDHVLPPRLRLRLAVEAAHPMPWAPWVGDAGEVLGLDHFGASAPAERLYQEFGLTAGDVARRARRLLGR